MEVRWTSSESVATASADPDLYSVNDYVLTKLLGKGAFAKVYEVASGEVVYAAKMFDKQAIRKIQFSRPGCGNIDRELAVWARISDHPNLLRLVEVIKDPSSRFVRAIMEHAAGGQLMPDSMMESSEITRGLPLAVVRRIAAQLLDAVTHCHALGVCHRDVKPSNCLLKEPLSEELLALLASGGPLDADQKARRDALLGRVVLKLCDFGEAMDVHESGSDYTRATTGSPAFNAPEMLSSSLPFSAAKQDAWACGMTLYMLLHGRPAFMSDHLVGLHEAIRSEEMAWNPIRRPPGESCAEAPGGGTADGDNEEGGDWGDLDDESNPKAWACAEDLVRKLLTKDPYKRWPVAKARASHPFVKGLPALADPIPADKRGKPLVGEETERPESAAPPSTTELGGAGALPDMPPPAVPMRLPMVMTMTPALKR